MSTTSDIRTLTSDELARMRPAIIRALIADLDRFLDGGRVLGGIGNLSFIDGDALLAFDTGPGCGLLDQWVSRGSTMAAMPTPAS